jgi:hypothetical protein
MILFFKQSIFKTSSPLPSIADKVPSNIWYNPLYIFMCILLIIVSLLSTIAIVYQVKYPMSEYSMVKRLKINEETDAK